MGTGLLLLVAYVLLVIGLLINWGAYDPLALVLLIASFSLIVLAFAWACRGGLRDRRVPGVPVFASALIALLLAAFSKPTAIYLTGPLYDRAYHSWLVVLVCLIALAYIVIAKNGNRLRQMVFVAAVVVALGFRLWMPVASPAPVIDVFAFCTESAQHLLEGKNPYTTPVADVYQGAAAGLGYSIKAYIYLPADLLIQTASYALTGDVRYGYVLAELVVALILWRLSRRRWGESTAQLIALLFLYNPRSLFVIEQSWVDPLILMFFALFLLLRERGKPTAASIAYGYMLFLKQHLLFAFFQWFILERNWKRILTGLAVGFLTLLPFAIWDWRGLLHNGILFTVNVPFRADSLTIFSFLASLGVPHPSYSWAVPIGAVIMLLTFIPQRLIDPLRGYLFSVTITMFGMFLILSTSFCNYYYLVAGQLIFLLALGGRPPLPEISRGQAPAKTSRKTKSRRS
jgi:hypothetical protein